MLDQQTGLQWMRCALGQTWNGKTCTGKPNRYLWNEIFGRAKDFNRRGGFAGYRNWRVPTIEELKTLIDKGVSPAIDQLVFPDSDSLFWSSSPKSRYSNSTWVFYSNSAWFVDFSDGYVYTGGKDGPGYVRLVRGGQ